jgi:hypothetical protein
MALPIFPRLGFFPLNLVIEINLLMTWAKFPRRGGGFRVKGVCKLRCFRVFEFLPLEVCVIFITLIYCSNMLIYICQDEFDI